MCGFLVDLMGCSCHDFKESDYNLAYSMAWEIDSGLKVFTNGLIVS